MSKFLAITIAAVLILSLFLTVFSIEDKISSDDPGDTTTVAPSSASTTAQTTAATTDYNLYLDSSGEFGYSMVDGLCYFFVRYQVPSGVSNKELIAIAEYSTDYAPKVRFSSDAKIWHLPQETVEGNLAGRDALYCYYDPSYFAGDFVYVSYCTAQITHADDALRMCEDIFDRTEPLIQVGVYGEEVGLPSGVLPN